MEENFNKRKPTATEVVKEIKRRTKRIFSPEEKIRIVNFSGKMVIEDTGPFQDDGSAISLNVSTLAPGLYVLVAALDDGSIVRNTFLVQ